MPATLALNPRPDRSLAVVRARDLSAESAVVWYVYVDGSKALRLA
jgi:hypothetical protein